MVTLLVVIVQHTNHWLSDQMIITLKKRFILFSAVVIAAALTLSGCSSSDSSTSESASWAIAKGTEREMIAKALNKYLFKSDL